MIVQPYREGAMAQQTNFAADAGRIADLQRDIRSGALTASALVERYLARIDAVDPAVQAWRGGPRDHPRPQAAPPARRGQGRRRARPRAAPPAGHQGGG